MILLDVLFSFLLFLAASALIIAYFVLVYAVIRAVWQCWLCYVIEYYHTHNEVQIAVRLGTGWGRRHTFWWWLITHFLALPAAVGFAVLCIYYQESGYAKTATDIAAARAHNLASFLEVFLFLLLLALYVRRMSGNREYPDYSDYFRNFSNFFRNRKFLCGIAAIFAVLLTLYVGGLAQWLSGGTVHKRAKLYFVAGESLNGFRRLLPEHTDDWKQLPLKALQKVIFNRAARLLPDDDGETAAWENHWFWSHYGTGFYGGRFFSAPGSLLYNEILKSHYGAYELLTTKNYESRYPASWALMENRWRCLEEMDAKPIRDPKVRRKLYMLEYPRLARAAYGNIFMQVPARKHGRGWKYGRSGENEERRLRLVTFEEQSSKLAPKLVRLVEEWQRTPASRALIAAHPKPEALGFVTLTRVLAEVMQSEIRAGTFRCENDSARRYLAARQYLAAQRQYFESKTGAAAYLREDRLDWLQRHGIDLRKDWLDLLDWLKRHGINIRRRADLYAMPTGQAFAQYVLEQRCGLPVPGSRSIDPSEDCWFVRKPDEKLTPDQCLEKLARDHLDEELQLMLDKLPRRAPVAPEPDQG